MRGRSGGENGVPHKVDAARRCADLLAALARTANVRLALRETGVSACWAYGRRRADPDFDARWRTAVRSGRRALATAAAVLERDATAPRPGGPMRLTMVGSSGKGTLRLEREKPCTFTDAKRAVFLATLRETCNVRLAAKAAGISAHGAYGRYHAEAPLRAAWDAALAEGRVHLEMALIGAARALCEPVPAAGAKTDGAVPITGMDAKLALQLLRLHAPRDARGRARGRWLQPADAEATRAAILAKVAAVRAARERKGGGTTQEA